MSNVKRRIISRPTREGWVFAGITLCILGSSFVQRVNLMALLFALMVTPVLLSVFFTRRSMRRLDARRLPPYEAFAGTPFQVEIEASNEARLGTAIAVRAIDRFQPRTTDYSPTACLPPVPARRSRRAIYTTTAPRRGRYRIGPITLATRMPFGLVECRSTLQANDELLVFPALGSVSAAWRRRTGRAAEAAKQERPAAQRSQEEVHGLREYRHGDNPRHIHWRTTARRGQLVVKEFDAVTARDNVLIVDAFAGSPELAEPAELTLRFVATACVDLCSRQSEAGGRLTVAIAGPTPVLHQGQKSAKLLHDLLGLLAVADVRGKFDWTSALSLLGPNHFSNAQAWIVTTRDLPNAPSVVAERFGSRVAANVEVVKVPSPLFESYFSPDR